MSETRTCIITNGPSTELMGIPHRTIVVEKSWLGGRWRRRIWYFEANVSDEEIVQWAEQEFAPVNVLWQLDLPF